MIAAQEMPGSVPVWRVEELETPAVADRPAVALDGERRRRWSTRRALRASPKAPSLRITISPLTLSISMPAGRSPTPIAFCSRCLFSTCTRSETACTAGSPAAAACACWSASSIRKRPATFLDFRPTLFFGVPTIYVRLLDFPAEIAREIGAFMRLFVSGSAPLSPQVFEEFRSGVRPRDLRTLRHD